MGLSFGSIYGSKVVIIVEEGVGVREVGKRGCGRHEREMGDCGRTPLPAFNSESDREAAEAAPTR